MQKKSENKARPGGSLFSSLIKSFWGIRDEVSPMEALMFALIPIGLVFLIWVFFTAGPPEKRVVSMAILPSPGDIFGVIPKLFSPEKRLLDSIVVSLMRIAVGFFIASCIALPLGILMGAFCRIEKMFTSLILVGSYLPIPTIVPLTVFWFGTGEEQKIGFLAIASFVYLLPAVVTAVNDVDDIFINTGYTTGASKWQIVRKILIPVAMPKIYDSLRMGFGVGFTWIIMAEMIGADSGLGYLLRQAQTRGGVDNTPLVFAILILIILMAFVMDYLWKFFYRQFFPYKEER